MLSIPWHGIRKENFGRWAHFELLHFLLTSLKVYFLLIFSDVVYPSIRLGKLRS